MSYQLALQALEEIIEEHELEFADNFRIARADDAAAMEKFEEQESGGCCGSMNTTFTDPNNVVWYIGCNYGH